MSNELETLPASFSGMGGGELIASGATLQKSQTQFSTAVAIQRPRRRFDVIKACEEEAVIGGDEFFYSWTVTTKEGKKELIEGLSIKAALAAARNWGNCGIPCSVEENIDTYIFTATFVDLETGFNLQRTFRQKKTLNIGKKYNERAEDIVFQIGQSKAIRNVILNALPSWLTTKMFLKAKENVIEKINRMGIAVAREKTVAFFQKYGITVDRIENKLNGKKPNAWDAEDLALLQGAMNTLISGQESADSLFPVHQETESKANDVAARFNLANQTQSPAPAAAEAAPPVEEKKSNTPTNDPSTVFDEKCADRNWEHELKTAGSDVEIDAVWKDFMATNPKSSEIVKMRAVISKKTAGVGK